MTKTNDGGPAFPHDDLFLRGGKIANASAGLSIRDYFAAKAMAAMLPGTTTSTELDGLAKAAYFMADAMLAEREKGD